MKHKVLIIFTLLLTFSLMADVITDELWLKAVDLKSKSLNIYPTESHYKTVVKNKKGEIEMTEDISFTHEEVNGQIVNTFVEGRDSEGILTKDSDSVIQYLKKPVLVEDMSVFKTETSPDFSLKRIGNETIEGIDYVKYELEMETDNEGNKVDSKGAIWLDATSGVPLKLDLDVDVHKMMVKDMKIMTTYTLSDSGYLTTNTLATELVISLVFKKMYINNMITQDNYQKLSEQ